MVCSDVIVEAAIPVFIRLFLRLLIVSIMNFVRTDRFSSPDLAIDDCKCSTMSFKADGSSCLSWGPESIAVSFHYMSL